MNDYLWETISAENAASILLALDDERDYYDDPNLLSDSTGDEETILFPESETTEES